MTDFRDRGGNLMFLSANNFFCRVDIDGDVMTRVGTWRDLGRPGGALVGVQYIGWNQMRYAHRAVRPSGAGIDGLDLRRARGCGTATASAAAASRSTRAHRRSPRGIKVLATIPNVFGRGMTAEMTYYETPNGAKVFAAGAFSLGGGIHNPVVAQVVSTLLDRLSKP